MKTSDVFIRDLGRALRVWKRDPRLPLIVTAMVLVQQTWRLFNHSDGSSSPGWVIASFVLILVFLGFYGTERIWYVAVDRGQRLTWRDIVTFTGEQFSRFFWLACVVLLLTIVPTSIVLGLTSSRDDVGRALLALAINIPLDIVLTFATVVIVFEDTRSWAAVRRSMSIIRETWPSCLPFVLVPPLAISFACQVLPNRSIGVAWSVALAVATTLFALLCKGAIVLFYADRYRTFNDVDDLRDFNPRTWDDSPQAWRDYDET